MALRGSDNNLTKRSTRTPLSPLRCVKVAGAHTVGALIHLVLAAETGKRGYRHPCKYFKRPLLRASQYRYSHSRKPSILSFPKALNPVIPEWGNRESILTLPEEPQIQDGH